MSMVPNLFCSRQSFAFFNQDYNRNMMQTFQELIHLLFPKVKMWSKMYVLLIYTYLRMPYYLFLHHIPLQKISPETKSMTVLA